MPALGLTAAAPTSKSLPAPSCAHAGLVSAPAPRAPYAPLGRLASRSRRTPLRSLYTAAAARSRVVEALKSSVLSDNAIAEATMGKVATLRSTVAKEAQVQWQRYQRALENQPVTAKALTSLAGLLVADVIAQAAEPGAYDAMRTARMAAFGLCWHGISGHYWYQLLDRVVWPSKPKASATIVTKMLADQLLWAPLNTAIFYASLAAMQGDMASIPGTLDAKLLPTVLAGYMIWPLAHLINFKYVPEKNRLLYINVVNLFWSIYLAHMANSSSGVSIELPRAQLPTTVIPVSNPAPPQAPPQMPTA